MPEVNDRVFFYPSENTLKKFKNKKRKKYAAVITDVNANSVDVTVFGVREIVYISGIEHKDFADEGKSCYAEY